MRTLANEACAPGRQRHHDHQRSPAHHLRIRSRGLTDMAHVQVHRADAATASRVKRHGRGAERGRAAQRAHAERLPGDQDSSRRSALNDIELTKQRVPRQEIMHFSRQLAAFVRAGIPLTDALQIVESGTENKRFRGRARRRRRGDPQRRPVLRGAAEPRAASSRPTTSASSARPSRPASSTSCSTSSRTTSSATSSREPAAEVGTDLSR